MTIYCMKMLSYYFIFLDFIIHLIHFIQEVVFLSVLVIYRPAGSKEFELTNNGQLELADNSDVNITSSYPANPTL